MSVPAPGSPAAQLAALQDRSSNAGLVGGIATGGHVVSGALVVRAGVAAYQAGPAALRCFAGRVAAPLAGALAGAQLAQMVHADAGAAAVAEAFGAQRLAGQGIAVAHVTHKIAHSNAFAGALAGLVAGLVVGAVVAVSVAAIIGTAGMAAPLVGAAVAFGAGAAGGFVGAAVAGAGAMTGHVTGMIADGSPDVFFEGFKAARVTSPVACDEHSGSGAPTVVIEGSRTINVNGFPLARIGHKTSCDAVIQEGCVSVFGDDTTQSFGTPDADLSVWQQLFLSAFEVLGTRSATREGGLLDGLLRDLFGEPIDVVTGEYADYRTDYEYQSVLPLRLSRAYAGRSDVTGLLGRRWICSWSQRLVFAPDDATVLFEDAAGQRLVFAVSGSSYDAVHLKAPHYHLAGDRARTRVFDSRAQHTLVFEAAGSDPLISRLSAIEDRNGNRVDFSYVDGRLAHVAHSDGVAFDVQTTPDGWLRSVAMQGEDAALVDYAYGAGGALTDVRSLFNGEFHYRYNDRGWLTQWRDSGPTQVDFEFDSAGRVVATRTPDGLYADRFVYAPAERRSQYIDATGACRTFWYNKDNLVVREEDPLGAVTETEWDSLERRRSVTDSAGRITRFSYDDAGRMIEAADWAGRVALWTRDAHGQVTRLEQPGGAAAWSYDARGNVVSETAPDGVVTTYAYDARGRMLSAAGPEGAEARWEYDRLGRVAAARDALGGVTRFDVDRFGRVRAVTDANGRQTRYEHEVSETNPRGAVSAVRRPDGGEDRFAYDREGLLAMRTGAEGQVTRFAHGAFDLLRRMTDAEGHATTLEYDGAARLSAVVNAGGARWTYSYDAAGRLALETDWAGRRTGYLRDALGRVRAKRLPDGSEQMFAWDERDRIVAVGAGPDRIVYEYDDADRLTRAATFRVGDGGALGPPLTDVAMVYDARGRLAREVQNGVPIDYRYDEAGRRIGRTSPSGEATYAFDPAGMLTGLSTNGHGLTFARDALGLETARRSVAEPGRDAFALRQSFDPCGRLAAQRAGRAAGDGFGPESGPRPGEVARAYEWDRSGRLVGVRDAARGDLRHVYDARDQVGRVVRPPMGRSRLGDERYLYDALMNVAASGAGAHEYRADCVVRAGGNTYVYDARGRMVSRTVARAGFRPRSWSYRWDGFDRLTEVVTPEEQRWRYLYDAFGRRAAKRCDTPGREAAISYLWDGAAVAEERRDGDGGGAVERWHYEPGGFRPVAKEVSRDGGGSRFYPVVTDHLGTPKEVFSSDGACLWQAEHSLWGRASAERMRPAGGGVRTASLATAEAHGFDVAAEAACALRFQNQWQDDESGLHYNLARYYDPDSGQYLSQDPIGIAGGLRTHGYVHDPAGWIDPWGLAACPQRGPDGRFLPSGKTPATYTRSSEYPSSYRAGVRESIIDSNTIRSGPNAGKVLTANGKYIDPADATIEHNQSVADHWNSTGYDSNQQVRNDFYNNQDNMSVLSRTDNSSQGGTMSSQGIRYRQDVGPGYRGN